MKNDELKSLIRLHDGLSDALPMLAIDGEGNLLVQREVDSPFVTLPALDLLQMLSRARRCTQEIGVILHSQSPRKAPIKKSDQGAPHNE